jgi:hypothetical protein
MAFWRKKLGVGWEAAEYYELRGVSSEAVWGRIEVCLIRVGFNSKKNAACVGERRVVLGVRP